LINAEDFLFAQGKHLSREVEVNGIPLMPEGLQAAGDLHCSFPAKSNSVEMQ
jgi:hypothetical protein